MDLDVACDSDIVLCRETKVRRKWGWVTWCPRDQPGLWRRPVDSQTVWNWNAVSVTRQWRVETTTGSSQTTSQEHRSVLENRKITGINREVRLYEGHLINGIILLIFKIWKIRDIRFVWNLILSTSCEFHCNNFIITTSLSHFHFEHSQLVRYFISQ